MSDQAENVFPSNRRLAQVLGRRYGRLVGLDPDPTIEENDLVHERVRGRIEDYHVDDSFDVITLRMVAEHVADPEGAVAVPRTVVTKMEEEACAFS